MSISKYDDIIDSRAIIERIEELTEQRTPRFVAGWNMPGYMPDSEPAEFDNADDAKRYIIDQIKEDEDAAATEEDEAEAEDLAALAEEVNLESDEFTTRTVGGYCYWVREDGTMGLDDEETEELAQLEALAKQGENYGDWEHGETLVRESYFETFAQEMAEDIGAIPEGLSWPCTCIDWEQAARELMQDYTTIDFDGVTYLMRT